MAIKEILVKDDDVLHTVCHEIVKFDDRLKELVIDLVETLSVTKNAVGLAAPQVSIVRRVAVVNVGEGPIVLINPVIVEQSGVEEGLEGCLSFPNRWARVKRPSKVTVKSFDENGKVKFFKGEGLKARAFCHEIDHLNGIVFLDRGEELGLQELKDLQKYLNLES